MGPDNSTGFVVMACRVCRLRYPSPSDDRRIGTCPACENVADVVEAMPAAAARIESPEPMPHAVAVLDNIRSALNVGTMIRAADGAGFGHVYLCGITADANHPKVQKTGLGSELAVTTEWVPDATATAATLQADGYALWALETTEASHDLFEIGAVPKRVALIVGNERAGVDPGLLRLADQTVHLPMQGAKSTLNVGVAFGIAAYRLRFGIGP